MPKKIKINETTQALRQILSISGLSFYADLGANPKDMSSFNKEISYESSSGWSVQTIVDKIGPNNLNLNCARFVNVPDNSDAIVQFDSADNQLTYTDGTSDSPFSVSLWYKRDTSIADANTDFLFSFSNGTNLGMVTLSWQNNDNRYEFRIQNSTSYIYAYALAAGIDNNDNPNDKWVHIVVTYNGVSSSTDRGMGIYINGNPKTISPSGGGNISAYSVSPKNANKLYIGAHYNGTYEGDGYFSQFAWFSDIVLSSEQVSSIYNANWGYSGYLNNPAKYLIQQRDNERIEYPTIKRMNSGNESGEYSIFFNDENAENNSSVLIDDFKVKDNQDYTNNYPNNSKWNYSPDVYIKQEFNGIDDKITDGALVLGGPGVSNERYISSIKKISNPTLNMTVLIGPYNVNVESTALSAFKLKLVKPTLGSRLKLQISENNVDWHDVPISKENLNINSSYGESYAQKFLSSEGYLKHPSVTILTSNISKTKSSTLPVLNIKIEKEKFSSILPNTMFYIRIAETGYDTSVDDGSWAIGNINILSRDKSVIRPGILTDSNFLYNTYADPNYLDDNLIYNYGIAKNLNLNQSPNIQQQSLKPFLDNLSPTNNDSFYNEGTSNSIYPGFDLNLTDKTKFEIDLSHVNDDESSFGIDKAVASGAGTSENDGSIFMVYWNKNNKKWEKIGQPVGYNDYASGGTINTYLEILTQSCVGFGGDLPIVGLDEYYPYALTKERLLSRNQLRSSQLPVSQFGFPYAGQYYATGSRYIKAKEIGITKPFLLEKINLLGHIKLQKYTNYEYDEHNLYGRKLAFYTENANPSSTGYLKQLLQIKPTFFILRQFKTKAVFNQGLIFNKDSAYEFREEYNVNIPSWYYLSSGSSESTYVDKTRELITFCQPNFLISGSRDSYSIPVGENIASLKELVDAGLSGDQDFLYTFDEYLSGSTLDITASLDIKADVKNVILNEGTGLGRVSGINSTTWSSGQNDLLLKKDSLNRTGANNNIISSRGLFNDNLSFKKSSENLLIQNKDSSYDRVNAANPVGELSQKSSYLIMPEDELIFGWQYPYLQDYGKRPIGKDSNFDPNDLSRNIATLFGQSKLIMYGSQIKNGKEFHEGLNQNLVTNNVHEVIGNEPVIDKWQIYTSGELYQSTADRFPFLDFLYGSHLKAGTINIASQDYLLSKDYRHGILGKVILTPESNIILYRSSDLSWSYYNNKTINIHQTYKNSIDKPWMRITGHTYWAYFNSNDVIHQKGQIPLPFPLDSETTDGESFLFEDNVEGKVKKVYSTLEQTVDNPIFIAYGSLIGVNITKTYKLSSILKNQFNLTDALRVYSDAKSFYGDYLNNSWFGTQRSYFDTTKSLRSSGSPKYYFNSRGYGQFSHFEQQGKDSKFNRVVTGTGLSSTSQRQIVGSPVVCKFVELQYFQDTSGRYKKNYKKISVEEIDGTSDSSTGFQSSNLSNNMTIVSPFYDDGIALNRSYGEKTVVMDVPSGGITVPSLSSLSLPTT